VTDPPAVADADRPPARAWIGEDWLAVLAGSLLMALVLAGARPPAPSFDWATTADLTRSVLGAANLSRTLAVGLPVAVFTGVAAFLRGGTLAGFAFGFPAVFLLGWLAQALEGHALAASWGLEYVIFALALGLFVSNALGVPGWLRDAAQSELYIKIGLVLLGARILFGDLLQAGSLGMVQAVLVVTVVWFVTFRLARALGVDDELGTMMATAVSICGVSAAIAACGAIQGDRRKLSYVTSLVLIVAAPMMVVMPQVIRAFEIPEIVGGAWLGGTLDTSASVVAAGELISGPARDAGVIVKLSQNVLIGVAAFLLTIWWTLRERGATPGRRPSAGIIWERFPKFVLGFMAASLVFSFLLDARVVTGTAGPLGALRTTWFAMAFVSIGLETRLAELVGRGSGRPALAFLGGQAFNVAWTLVLAYLIFGGILVEVPTFLG